MGGMIDRHAKAGACTTGVRSAASLTAPLSSPRELIAGWTIIQMRSRKVAVELVDAFARSSRRGLHSGD
ncbi:MAG: hypothetical protein AW07_04099 [Candidatus Accumulibacter sp. SK-11]|nr:MAG: hypothetical protein AW07_04099 [Candidatus Accumulibacter sp. SK-11]